MNCVLVIENNYNVFFVSEAFDCDRTYYTLLPLKVQIVYPHVNLTGPTPKQIFHKYNSR